MLKIVTAKEKDLGDFVVRRAFPQIGLKTVGPFVFLDQMGPVEFAAGVGMDVRPHPHIGLSTLTYLFEGRIQHRDSLGNNIIIKKNEVNWMTAGRGIVHSERSSDDDRKNKQNLFGLQFWVALPPEKCEIEPSFQHLDQPEIPSHTQGSATVRVIAGSWDKMDSPMKTHFPTLFLDVEFSSNGKFEFDLANVQKGMDISHTDLEIGVYLVKGTPKISSEGFGPRDLHRGEIFVLGQEVGTGAQTESFETVQKDFTQISLEGSAGDRLVILGGKKLPKKPTVWWNFVAYDLTLLEKAKQMWREQKFPKVPGETEFIPLPE